MATVSGCCERSSSKLLLLLLLLQLYVTLRPDGVSERGEELVDEAGNVAILIHVEV